MPDWTTFYVAVAGAGATLAGLLFVAIQINLEMLVADLGNRWRATARSTFAIYVLLIVVSLLFLIPSLDQFGQGLTLIIAAVFGIYRGVRTWWPVWVSSWHKHSERLLQTAWYLIGPTLAYVALIVYGINLYNGNNPNGVHLAVGVIFVALFGIALRNSWNLVFEVSFERKQHSLGDKTK